MNNIADFAEKKILFAALIFPLIYIFGCVAIGVPVTSNPAAKIESAVDLLEDWGPNHRPLPAEHLIQEAIVIYKERGDGVGLAQAYKTYAFFLQSEAVGNWEGHYRKYGFMDKTVTFDNRKQIAIEYYEMAKDIYEKNGRYDGVTNIYNTLGSIYHYQNQREKACDAFGKSLENYLKFKKINPEETVIFPSGFKNYEDYIETAKKEAGCN